LILSGTNTYSGTTQLSAGASVTLKTGNTAGPSTILPDTTVLRLGQGTVRLQGVATETVASTTLDAGFSKVIRDFASTATLNLGAITVNSGGALQVTPGTVTTTTPNLSSGILGGYALAGSASWAVKNSGTGLIEALDETDYSSFWAVGNHTNIDDDNLDGSIFQTNATTGTLRFGAPPSGEFQDIALIINQTATIANGGILMNRDFGQYNAAINPGITSPKLVSGTNHLYIHQFNELGTLTINASIQENTIPLHFVKTGPGKLVLAGNNLFSGSVTIAGGTLQAGNNSALSGNPLGVTSTPIANDGILALNVGPGPELAIFNVINGSGSIRQIGDGESALVEPNTYTGRTSVIAGVLSAQNPLALGSVVGLTAVSDGAKLVLSGDGGVTTTFERIALKGGTLDLTNGAVLGGQVITTVPSTINAPGGRISITGAGKFPSNLPNPSTPFVTVDLGSAAKMNASGVALFTYYSTLLQRRFGTVLGGGNSTVAGNVLAEAGSLMDVSGANGIYDLFPWELGLLQGRMGRTIKPHRVDSAGGSIVFKGGEML
jgi:autotransporter-associated beta strand protein